MDAEGVYVAAQHVPQGPVHELVPLHGTFFLERLGHDEGGIMSAALRARMPGMGVAVVNDFEMDGSQPSFQGAPDSLDTVGHNRPRLNGESPPTAGTEQDA